MSKEHENIRLEVKKQFDKKYADLKKKADRVDQLDKINLGLSIKNAELTDELSQYKEWVERLLEYMDMTPEDLQSIKKSNNSIQEMENLIDKLKGFNSIFNAGRMFTL